MQNENEDKGQDLLAQAALKHRCAECGYTMHQETVDGILSWVCDDPECGFTEPV